MQKALRIGLLLWAMACVLPVSASAQDSLDFTGPSPGVVYNGTDYFLTIPELGFMGDFYGIQWKLNQMDGSWSLTDSWNVSRRGFVVTAPPDFTTGSFSTFDLSSLATTNNIGAVHGDATALSANGDIYVINRFGRNSVIVYENADFSSPREFSVAVDGENTNPQTLVLISAEKAYVILNNSDFIYVVNPRTGLEQGRIDISAYADADGIPEAGMALLQDGYVYVALQLLDQDSGFSPSGPGKILKINAATDEVAGAADLTLRNPTSLLYHSMGKRLLVGCSDSFFPPSVGVGGIEVVNPAAMVSEGVIVSEAQLGGDLNLNGIVMADVTKGYALISDEDFNNAVVSFDLVTGAKLADVYGPVSFEIGGGLAAIAVHQGRLYVCDRTLTAPGVRIFDTLSETQITAAPINVGLSPAMIIFY